MSTTVTDVNVWGPGENAPATGHVIVDALATGLLMLHVIVGDQVTTVRLDPEQWNALRAAAHTEQCAEILRRHNRRTLEAL